MLQIWKAFNKYFWLNAEQRQVIHRKQLNGTHSAEQWLTLLSKLADFDELAGKARSKLGAWMTALGFLLFFSGCSATFFAEFFPRRSPILPLTFTGIGVGLVLILIMGLINRYLRRRDLHDPLRYFVVPLLVVLKEETKAQEPIQLFVALNSRRNKKHIVNIFQRPPKKKPHPFWWWASVVFTILTVMVYSSLFLDGFRARLFPEFMYFVPVMLSVMLWFITAIIYSETGPYPNTRTTVYQQLWFELSTRLHDHTRLRMAITDITQERRRQRRNPRNKVKTKTKFKTRTQAVVTLLPSLARYRLNAELLQSPTDLRIQTRERDTRAVIQLRQSYKQEGLDTSPPLQMVLHLIGQGYRRLA
jgi:hypothetical protein